MSHRIAQAENMADMSRHAVLSRLTYTPELPSNVVPQEEGVNVEFQLAILSLHIVMLLGCNKMYQSVRGEYSTQQPECLTPSHSSGMKTPFFHMFW